MKKKIRRVLYGFIKGGGLVSFVAAVVLAIAYAVSVLVWEKPLDFMDWTIFTSFVIVMFLEVLGRVFQPLLLNKLEDSVKLTTDYKALIKKYQNSSSGDVFLHYTNPSGTMCVFPITYEKLDNCTLRIEDYDKHYQLPEWIIDNYDEIFMVHDSSKVYNQLSIRVDKWEKEEKEFVIHTSRTTYFNSLVTNRAMDYKLNSGLSVRDMFFYGPFITPLEESQLSNHLGFNGFVETNDGYIPFIKRKAEVSIAKHTYGDSIGAALKAKYVLEKSHADVIDTQGIINAMIHEVYDELKIEKEQQDTFFEIKPQVISAYRDLVEGGKPQLLFYAKTFKSKQELSEMFLKKGKKKGKSIEQEMATDGDAIIWIPKADLSKLEISNEFIKWKHVTCPMVPSASASVVMLIQSDIAMKNK